MSAYMYVGGRAERVCVACLFSQVKMMHFVISYFDIMFCLMTEERKFLWTMLGLAAGQNG